MLTHPAALPYLEIAGLTAPRANDRVSSRNHRVPVEPVSATPRFAGLRRGLAGLVGRIASWQQSRRLVRRLSSLDDRLLADIGIERADIPDVARGAFVREVAAPFVAWPQPRQVLRTIKGRRPTANDSARKAAA
jgi:uncharacterized protein YjiS (DUF1127 family)